MSQSSKETIPIGQNIRLETPDMIPIGAAIGAGTILALEVTLIDGPISTDSKRHEIDREANEIERSVSLENTPEEYYDAHVEAAALRTTKPGEMFPGAMPLELLSSAALGAVAGALLFKKLARR